MSEVHQFLKQSLFERIEFNKLMKLKKEFANFLDTVSPIHKFSPKVFIAHEEDLKKEINFYPEMIVQIYFPTVIEDHIREINEFVVEMVQKRFTIKSLGFMHRVILGEEFDFDFTVARVEDYDFNFVLFYNLEDSKRFTSKLNDQIEQSIHTRNVLKLLKVWKRNKMLNFDLAILEKPNAIQFFTNKPFQDYSVVLSNYFKKWKEGILKVGVNKESKKIISAIDESIQAIDEKFYTKILS
jgi:hypothetical protein